MAKKERARRVGGFTLSQRDIADAVAFRMSPVEWMRSRLRDRRRHERAALRRKTDRRSLPWWTWIMSLRSAL